MNERRSKEDNKVLDNVNDKKKSKLSLFLTSHCLDRNSVTALTKMFDKKNTNNERRSVYNKIPPKIKENVNITEETNQNNLQTERNRSSSIIDKISMFNKNAQANNIIKKDDAIVIVAPSSNYVKVVDEQTGKSKWIDGSHIESLKGKEKNCLKENLSEEITIKNNKGIKLELFFIDYRYDDSDGDHDGDCSHLSRNIIKESNSVTVFEKVKRIEYNEDIIVNKDFDVNKEIKENYEESDSASDVSEDNKLKNGIIQNDNHDVINIEENITGQVDSNPEINVKLNIKPDNYIRSDLINLKNSEENKINNIEENDLNNKVKRENNEIIHSNIELDLPGGSELKNKINSNDIARCLSKQVDNDVEYKNYLNDNGAGGLNYNFDYLSIQVAADAEEVMTYEEYKGENKIEDINVDFDVKDYEVHSDKNNSKKIKNDNIDINTSCSEVFNVCFRIPEEGVINSSNVKKIQNYNTILDTLRTSKDKDDILFSEQKNKFDTGLNQAENDFKYITNLNDEKHSLIKSNNVKNFMIKYKYIFVVVVLLLLIIVMILIILR
jgi:hypothetical protein